MKFGFFLPFWQNMLLGWLKNNSKCYGALKKGVWRYTTCKKFFFKSCTFRHMFSVPHSIFCYFLATPATYFAKMAKKSKFHCIWLIFRKIALDQGKKSSATSKMSPMGSFRMFPHHITWKADFWKVSRKPHLEYSHSLLKKYKMHVIMAQVR